jgi:hypothetical protein
MILNLIIWKFYNGYIVSFCINTFVAFIITSIKIFTAKVARKDIGHNGQATFSSFPTSSSSTALNLLSGAR